MSISRRTFLALGAAATAGMAFGGLGLPLDTAAAPSRKFKLRETVQSTSICCYCAVACGLIVSTDKKSGRSVNIEGDPDHPVSEGTLCPKGASIWQLTEQSPRVLEPMYRAPGSAAWEKKPWDWVLDRVARRIKATRDASFETANDKGQAVNRTRAIASVGSAALDNEEGWLYQALLRSLGIVYLESHARI